ncbi:unnamed protein product [Rotaria sordida]|uniref:Uncharacterized protein n=1 Tax=Rotaria sordida TaxID=392033 RepID=A0A819IJN9_9BILA|nr:unnamed protein product [Rotaria sordida]
MFNQNSVSSNNRRLGFNAEVDRNVVGLFGPSDDEAPVPRSPFVLTGLAPEIEQGNIEYKLKLVDPSPERLEHLITQMHWRLEEGQGEAFYEIGVEDCGTLKGVNTEELEASLATRSHP